MLAPRAAFSSALASAKADERAPAAYIAVYIAFLSVLTGACAAFSATGRITASQLLSLSIIWAFLPILHVLIARIVMRRQVGVFLTGHAPWSLWLIAAAAMTGLLGYAAYWWMLLLTIVPGILTLRIVFAFSVEVLGLERRAAIGRTLVHQSITWLIALIYLERAVSLIPRMQGFFG